MRWRTPSCGERNRRERDPFSSRKITDLRAGDQDRNAVGEHDDGARKVFHHMPIPVTPSNTRSTPPSMVHANNPSIPCFATMPATTTTKAPSARQFAFWNRPAAKSGIPSQWRNRVPLEGRVPKHRKRHRQRQRDEAHGQRQSNRKRTYDDCTRATGVWTSEARLRLRVSWQHRMKSLSDFSRGKGKRNAQRARLCRAGNRAPNLVGGFASSCRRLPAQDRFARGGQLHPDGEPRRVRRGLHKFGIRGGSSAIAFIASIRDRTLLGLRFRRLDHQRARTISGNAVVYG